MVGPLIIKSRRDGKGATCQRKAGEVLAEHGAHFSNMPVQAATASGMSVRSTEVKYKAWTSASFFHTYSVDFPGNAASNDGKMVFEIDPRLAQGESKIAHPGQRIPADGHNNHAAGSSRIAIIQAVTASPF